MTGMHEIRNYQTMKLNNDTYCNHVRTKIHFKTEFKVNILGLSETHTLKSRIQPLDPFSSLNCILA